jgi:hypothetical protein
MSRLEDLAAQVRGLAQQADSVTGELTSLTKRAAHMQNLVASLARSGTDVRSVQTSLAASANASRIAADAASQAARLAAQFADSLVDGRGSAINGPGPGKGVNTSTPPATSSRSPQTLEQIADWIGDINPNFDWSDPDSAWDKNCGSCAIQTAQALAGGPVAQAGPHSADLAQMSAAIGQQQTPMSPEDIATRLRSLGPGSNAIVGIDKVTGPGHWFNAYFDGHDVWCVDGQTGTVGGWPPDYGATTNWDAALFPGRSSK